MLWLVVLGFGGLFLAALAQAGPITGDCASCHAGESVLPLRHVPTSGMAWDGCVACHQDSNEDLNLAASMPLSHLHGLRGIGCESCHPTLPDGEAGEPESTVCESCHGSMTALARMEWPNRPNPHDSHYPGLECTFCHHAHEPSEDFCQQCHDFGYQIP